jgi:hypothetical protein
MSFVAGNAARGAAATTVSLPMGQLAVVGLGVFAFSNPDKFFLSLSKGAQLLHTLSSGAPSLLPQSSVPNHHLQQPIIIHHQAPASGGAGAGSGGGWFIVRLALGAGVCWGSYVVLITVLPDAAKSLLPVNQKVFNKAVTALGKAVINLKDTLMVQINNLSRKQDDLSQKQDSTHTEVLVVKDNIQDMRGDLALVQEALDLCHASLTESERRTSYIARGVQLLTRGVSTILPEDENLLHDLVQFNIAGDEFQSNSTPLQQHRLRQTLQAMHQATTLPNNNGVSCAGAQGCILPEQSPSSDPENEVPGTPDMVNASVSPIYELLKASQ